MSTANPSPSPILGNITEICFVTPNIYTTIDGLSKTGIGPFQIFDFNASTVREQELYGERGTDLFRLKVAFAKQGSLVVEIMQPLPGGSGTKPSLMQAYLDENGGKAGVQHIAWDMGDVRVPMEERISLMKARGFELVMQGVWMGTKGTCRFVFFDTLGTIGTVFETIVFSEDWEDPEGGVVSL
ncbi:hypothetical protein PV11_06631 [Exophiala sideris]|uniref:VOC domain-containing protein n=1 Tax=Exophiala sideris TaxID=1016849 RepID=A0A0D1WV68_9EURO|nr:hypothetical protein PV11_06631 [Exophiala sideris]